MIKKLAKSVTFVQHIDYGSGELIWLIADANNYGVSRYITQGQDWKTAHSIGFYSHWSTEVNYPTYEQEILAIITCIKPWYSQLTGTHFTILSDYTPLQYWKT